MHIISGIFKNKKIITPKGNITRPTSSQLRETLFNICQLEIPDSSFLDLFAGSGAMGLEALSRGASQATFIENNREAFLCIKENIKNLNIEDSSQIYFGDVFSFIEKLSKQKRVFDIIYADPPYEAKDQSSQIFSSQVIQMVDRLPLLKSGGLLFVEDSIKALEININLETLTLKSSRKMGRSSLHYFQKH